MARLPRKKVRARAPSHMTDGEKAIWAAAYVAEYRHWMSSPNGRVWQPFQAAKFAIAKAADAVVSARMAIDSSGLENAVHQAFLKTMVGYRGAN